jgi:metallophosphoesterase (TIGR00282 family)
MKLLFLGDIVGRPGRDLIRRHVRALASRHDADLVIANGENAAGGAGITRENMLEIRSAGVDVITTGNHVWDKRETLEFIGNEPRLLRPANYPDGTPGAGSCVVDAKNGVRVGVINVMGRVFLHAIDDPFRAAEREIARVRGDGAQVIFVDVHAETTSEKIALSYYLDGKVTAVIGTHTHVQTADERILAGGTACLTDVGMTGPHDSVIGIDKDAIIARFLSGLPARFETASGDPRLNGVIINVDPSNGRATGITRLSLSEDELKANTDAITLEARA